MAALRTSGITASWLLDSAMNGQAFRTYVPTPKLQSSDTLFIDNLPAHKIDSIRETLDAAGAQFPYLPADFPDFNPIEPAFATLKGLMRTAAARTIPDLWEASGRRRNRFAPDECRAYLTAAGYDAT